MNRAPFHQSLKLLVSLCALCVCTVASAQDGETRTLGTNLDAVTDYSSQLPFRDLFLSSRAWFTQCRAGVDPGCTASNAWDTGEAHLLDLDANGWVRALPSANASVLYRSVATFWDLPPEFAAGRYVVLYEGSGSLEYGLGARKVEGSSRSGRDVIDVDIERGGILLRKCKAQMRIIAFIQDEHSIKEIMKSQGIADFRAPPPIPKFIDTTEAIDELSSYDSFEPTPDDF